MGLLHLLEGALEDPGAHEHGFSHEDHHFGDHDENPSSEHHLFDHLSQHHPSRASSHHHHPAVLTAFKDFQIGNYKLTPLAALDTNDGKMECHTEVIEVESLPPQLAAGTGIDNSAAHDVEHYNSDLSFTTDDVRSGNEFLQLTPEELHTAHVQQTKVAQTIAGTTLAGAFALFSGFVYKLSNRNKKMAEQYEKMMKKKLNNSQNAELLRAMEVEHAAGDETASGVKTTNQPPEKSTSSSNSATAQPTVLF
ncbi:unnamed protein product [Amoebophrya sp. A120]|nr:unnamed protein product [Amoebophrya sp. A120]|eukprot:GSA120T00012330001.1